VLKEEKDNLELQLNESNRELFDKAQEINYE
jgi:hypothetical protein